MLHMIIERENEVKALKQDNTELQRRFLGFKNEFVELLDDRDQSKNDNLRLFGQLEV